MPVSAAKVKAEPALVVVAERAEFLVPVDGAVEHVQVFLGGAVPVDATPESVAHMLALGLVA
jgi:hypothetical protein